MTTIQKQFEQAKKRYPNVIILFRKGDFYEAFQEDATFLESFLGISLTHRVQGDDTWTMTGFPAKNLEGHLRKLIRSGKRVAICDEER